ncbi:MAG: CoA transferase [Alphaproteobacteria bacterium]|nr:CoA transferase [Alphaproteobacteria bacterium]
MSERLLFQGLKVIDCASFIAAPAAATILADFGAEVIKIEPPGEGDPYRQLVGMPGLPESPHNYCWILDNRSKKGLTLDLKNAAAQAVLRRLVAGADVFITNSPPKVRERLNIAHADLAPLNPRLIYAALTGFGEEGPDADKPGFDSTSWWARSGLMDVVRPNADSPPARSVPGLGDHPTAMALYAAIVTALYRRQLTGKGGMATTSLLANGLWANGCYVQAVLSGAQVPRRPPRERAVNAVTNIYRARDDRWFLLAIVREERYWEAFARCLGRPDLLVDPRFATMPARHANASALVAILDEVFAAKDSAEWCVILQANGITFGAIERIEDVRQDPQAVAAGALVPHGDDRAGAGLTVNSPVFLDGEAKRPPALAPGPGEHTEEVLLAAGYDRAEIERLRQAGAFG